MEKSVYGCLLGTYIHILYIYRLHAPSGEAGRFVWHAVEQTN